MTLFRHLSTHKNKKCLIRPYHDIIARLLLCICRIHTDDVLNNDGIWWVKERLQQLWHIRETNAWSSQDRCQVRIAVDPFTFMTVL